MTTQTSDLYKKAKSEYDRLPEVSDDDLTLDGTIAHLVYRAQHELDLVDEGERDYIDDPMPKSNYKKIQRFVNKWNGK
jgi:hypothetical protein